jgi:hypothetical protein
MGMTRICETVSKTNLAPLSNTYDCYEMEPIVPPKLVTTDISGTKAHYNHDDWYDATHVCHDSNGRRQVIMRPVANRGLGAERSCKEISVVVTNHCDKHTEGLIVSASLFQTRLQDLGRVLRIALALQVNKPTADGRHVFRDTLQLCDSQLQETCSRVVCILRRIAESGSIHPVPQRPRRQRLS